MKELTFILFIVLKFIYYITENLSMIDQSILEISEQVNEINVSIDEVEKQISALQEKLKGLKERKESLSDVLLEKVRTTDEFTTTQAYDVETESGLAITFVSKNVPVSEYADEQGLIDFLKGCGHTELIKESLNKAAFKKAIKIDEGLRSGSESFMETGKVNHIEYVQVTTIENRQRQLEHINAGK